MYFRIPQPLLTFKLKFFLAILWYLYTSKGKEKKMFKLTALMFSCEEKELDNFMKKKSFYLEMFLPNELDGRVSYYLLRVIMFGLKSGPYSFLCM